MKASVIPINTTSQAFTKQTFDLFLAAKSIQELSIPPTMKLLMFLLAFRMNKKGTCFPGLKRIAQDAGLKDEKHVGKLLRSLHAQGYLNITRRDDGFGKHKSNLYSFTERVSFHGKVGSVSSLSGSHTTLTTKSINYQEEKNLDLSLKGNRKCLSASPHEITANTSGKNLKKECGLSLPDQMEREEAIKKSELEKMVSDFNHPTLTVKALVKFWFSLIDRYYPDYVKVKLMKYQFDALKELRPKDKENNRFILRCLAYAVSDWDVVSKFIKSQNLAYKLPVQPTLVAIRDHLQPIATFIHQKIDKS